MAFRVLLGCNVSDLSDRAVVHIPKQDSVEDLNLQATQLGCLEAMMEQLISHE